MLTRIKKWTMRKPEKSVLLKEMTVNERSELSFYIKHYYCSACIQMLHLSDDNIYIRVINSFQFIIGTSVLLEN